jgi:cysteinyl-tRNA synthetase
VAIRDAQAICYNADFPLSHVGFRTMLKLYNTLTRQKEVFTPIEANKVRMYVCGMTVYDYCHLGHARVMVVFDMVARWLRSSGYDVTYVRNITDIDDKIIKRALENQESICELTQRFIDAMDQDSAALGVLRPDHEPRATAYVPGMIKMIEALIANGHAYAADNGDVYYAVHAFAGYGKLSGKSLDDLRAGERVGIDLHKRDPLDFVLWKSAKPNEPSWPSPWGAGRPGWHIECSVMSEHLLGEHFDIHGGGADLQFPHHENEIAQSEGAHQHTFVNYWLHNGFIRVDDEKMSKSLGNFFTIREVLQKYDPEVVRFFILRAHYRSPLNYSDAHLDDARSALTRLYTALKNVAPEVVELNWHDDYALRFKAAMDDDFNTVEAMAVLFDLANEVHRSQSGERAGLLKALAGVLGLLQRDPQSFLQGGAHVAGELPAAEIESLIVARREARAAKNWAESDRIRDALAAQGVVLEDGAGGTGWRRG